MTAHLKHYGVKGMKWGVRKEDFITKKGRQKSKYYLEYQNKRGKWKTSRLTKSMVDTMKRTNTIDQNYDIRKNKNKAVVDYVKMRKRTTISAIALGTAYAAGQAFCLATMGAIFV